MSLIEAVFNCYDYDERKFTISPADPGGMNGIGEVHLESKKPVLFFSVNCLLFNTELFAASRVRANSN